MADLYRDLLQTTNSKRQTSASPKKVTEGSGRSNPLLYPPQDQRYKEKSCINLDIYKSRKYNK